ncbi:hypothetical protein Lsai_2144 [Legionella sainthelensi]|uniref:Uncharacterized protein n=1 Tax=Legionella sainthelensi TaxID=28087 RepID=A0A0W0YHL4_9GAMM|nr:hypothetical protein [Legionella sainthelensi]KTD56014.1 hypothetical protein Lsai_2144 [Legionella sainthelensi]VEH28807.1 Uncharacterised protein [Legionella sainthelensi]
MGGQLYLNDGSPPNRKNVCVSGYERGKENFALSNFDDNKGKGYDFVDPHLGKIHFPTSEHYLHFQKIKPEYKQQYLAAWQNEKSPAAILGGLRNPGSPYHIPNAHHAYMTPNGFNNAWDNDKVFVQMQINAAKYQQSQEFRDSIHKSIELGDAFGDNQGPATIIEDTSSLSKGQKPEEEWGTGPGGKGKNILGNSQTAFAMMIKNKQFDENSPAPKLDTLKTAQVAGYYANAQIQYQQGVQVALKDVRKKSGKDQGFNQPDTSDLSPSLVQKTSPTLIKNKQQNAQSFTTAPLPTPPPQVNHRNPFQNLFSSTRPNHVYSSGGNQRLVVQDNKIVGYEFRRSSTSSWEKSTDKTRFQGLVDHFNQTQQKQSSHVYSSGGNQRLVVQDDKIVGYEFRRSSTSNWEKSTDKTRFQGLVDHFNQTQQKQSSKSHMYSSGGNQRLVIHDDRIVGYEFRRSSTSNWEKSTDKSRFQGLVDHFNQTQQMNSPNPHTMNTSVPQSILTSPKSSQTLPKEGSSQVSTVIQEMVDSKAVSKNSDIPLVSKGDMKGTFKMAFDNAQDAQTFKKLLDDFGFKGLSYYGSGEKYPMQHNGQQLSHIVRFENDGNKATIPSEALDFLRIKLDDEEKVADIVEQMGFDRPEPANRYTF